MTRREAGIGYGKTLWSKRLQVFSDAFYVYKREMAHNILPWQLVEVTITSLVLICRSVSASEQEGPRGGQGVEIREKHLVLVPLLPHPVRDPGLTTHHPHALPHTLPRLWGRSGRCPPAPAAPPGAQRVDPGPVSIPAAPLWRLVQRDMYYVRSSANASA